jgi:hypothetical protein
MSELSIESQTLYLIYKFLQKHTSLKESVECLQKDLVTYYIFQILIILKVYFSTEMNVLEMFILGMTL